MAQSIGIKAGDTEPIRLTIGGMVNGVALANLDNLSAATFYARKAGATVNHVTAGAMTVVVSADRSLQFDPVAQAVGGGNAFPTDSEGIYHVVIKAVWSDTDQTRHPGLTYLKIVVTDNYE